MGTDKNIKLHIVTDIKCISTRWVRTNTSKNSTRRNKAISSASSSASDVGSCVISLPSIVLRDPLVQTKHEDSATEQNKDTSSTVCAFDVVDARSLSPREQLTVNRNVKVSIKSSFNVVLDPKPRREQED